MSRISGVIKERLGVAELKDKNGEWRALLAEFLGNFMLNFFACLSSVNLGNDSTGRYVLIALTAGFVVMAIVQSIGHVSGAHINPAVTAGMLAVGKITIIKGLLYIVVQCLGSTAGSAAVKAVTPEDKQGNLGMTVVAEGVGVMQAFGIEFSLGFVLVLVVFGVCDPNKPETRAVTAVVIGLTISLGHLAAIDFTGSSMNPARTLGSAIISGIWDNHWMYWLGPILGGIAAALIYKYVFAAPNPDPGEQSKKTDDPGTA